MPTALGFRTHSGWAAVVAVTIENHSPAVVGRWEIALCDPGISGGRQPYHTAEPMPLHQATEFLQRCTQAAHAFAVRSLGDICAELQARGASIVGCGLLTGSGRALPPLEKSLASHPAIHTAEGEFYRDAIVRACAELDLPLTRLREREAYAQASGALAVAPEKIVVRLMDMGRSAGPPWSQDQKLAALAAWVASGSTGLQRASALSARRSA